MDKYQKEWEETIQWANRESEAVLERLKRTGKLQPGLDGNKADFKYIHDEVERRRIDIQKRAREEQDHGTR